VSAYVCKKTKKTRVFGRKYYFHQSLYTGHFAFTLVGMELKVGWSTPLLPRTSTFGRDVLGSIGSAMSQGPIHVTIYFCRTKRRSSSFCPVINNHVLRWTSTAVDLHATAWGDHVENLRTFWGWNEAQIFIL